MITEIKGQCQFAGCDKPATLIAAIVPQYDYEKKGYSGAKVGCYCDEHATKIANTGNPEYINDCPNCGCRHGVN